MRWNDRSPVCPSPDLIRDCRGHPRPSCGFSGSKTSMAATSAAMAPTESFDKIGFRSEGHCGASTPHHRRSRLDEPRVPVAPGLVPGDENGRLRLETRISLEPTKDLPDIALEEIDFGTPRIPESSRMRLWSGLRP